MTVFPPESRLLLGPGPSPVSDRILEAMSQPTVGHLDPQFLAIMDAVNEGLRLVFGTRNPMTFPVSATGSAGMEAALVNVLEHGDTAIVGINGVFGGRMAEICRRAGAQVVPVEAPWGEAVREEDVLKAMDKHPDARVVALVHAETSTGVWQPLEAVGSALRDRESLLVVDAVTSLAGIPVSVDDVGIDVCYSGTQKCLGVPPGLAPISFSPKAMSRIRSRSSPCQSWYLDVTLIAGYLGSERAYHHTAPINMIYGLHQALVDVRAEGLDARFARHKAVGDRLKSELTARGFGLFAEEGRRLPQLTSATLPDGLE
ncbi:MAG: alanine--glyoxylate aminotransferase family protein, partial [Gemmatimonadota bacterium]|nr:alanine--glyoxylate aminotransferase family protein [Gemmatimonadota bacterium]